MTPEMLAADLDRLKQVVHFHRIQMVGGEPTLNKHLPELMRVARASGIANEVMVISNGGLLPRMSDEFWEQMDSLQLSIYPGLDPEIPGFAAAQCKRFGKAFFSTVYTDFHQQFRTERNDGSHFKDCHWRRDCYSVERGFFFLCPQSIFFPEDFMGLPEGIDGLSLDGITQEKFDAFLEREEPLNACKMCMANEMKSRPWTEATGKDDWRARSNAPEAHA